MARPHVGESFDVFGINLNLSNLASYRVDELRLWLKCRGGQSEEITYKSCVYTKVRTSIIN